jgi:hypothetical protein
VEGAMRDEMSHAAGPLLQEQAEALMDKFLETFVTGSFSSSNSSRSSMIDD